MKNVLGCLSMAALAVILAAPISAQSTAVRANVPFDFMVGGRTLSAGAYEFGVISQGGVLQVMSDSGATSAMVASAGSLDGAGRTEVVVEFHRYGNEYFLHKIWDGSSNQGREISPSRIERELATRASLNRPETVMVLARR
jgi:hypothetical protein